MRKLHLAALMASTSIIGIAAPAFAADQPQPGDQPASVQEVVVTAQKRQENLKDVPMSVTALNGAALDKLQVTDFADYAALVPGLSLVSNEPGVTRLILRGQNSGGVGSTVAVYVDDSPFGSSTALLNGSILTGDFEAWDLQRIEVLRGPQGTLYGANSEGGLLKFVTNAPQLDRFNGAIEAGGQSVSHGGTAGDIKGMINVPISSWAALRVSGFHDEIPGFIRNTAIGGKNINHGYRDGQRLEVLAKPTDALTVKLSAWHQHTVVAGTSEEFVNPATLSPVNGDLTQDSKVPQPSKFDYGNYAASVDYKLPGATFSSVSTWGRLNTARFQDITDAPAGAGGPTYGTLLSFYTPILFPGVTATPPFAAAEPNAANLKKFTQEFRVASPTGGRVEWLLGAYYTEEKGALIQDVLPELIGGGAVPGSASLEHALVASQYDEAAVFGDLTYRFNEQFDVQLGGRESHSRQSAQEILSGPLAGPGANFTAHDNGSVFTWSVAPRFHLDANTLLYARISTGWRPGGPNVLPPAAPPNVPRIYGPDKTTNYEAGVRSTLLDGKLSLDVDAFFVDWKNIQVLAQVSGYGINENGASAQSKGVEWNLAWRPIEHLSLGWTGAYTDAHLTGPVALPGSTIPNASAGSGSPLPFAPKWSTTLDAEYQATLSNDYDWFVGGDLAYTGTRYSDFGADPTGSMQVRLPSFTTVSARLGVENSKYRVELWGRNLTDKRGITSFGSSTSAGNVIRGNIGVIQPRTIGVTLSAKF